MLAAHSNLVAELADFLVADDEHGFVFAEFGLAGDKHETVVHMGRLRSHPSLKSVVTWFLPMLLQESPALRGIDPSNL